MQTIEAGGKLYQVDTSQITLGDWYNALLAMQASKSGVDQVIAVLTIIAKALGPQINEIPVVYYGYVLGQVVMLMASPFSSEEIDNEVRGILDDADMVDEEDKGV